MIEERANSITENPAKKQKEEMEELKRLISEKDELVEQVKKETDLEKQRLTKETENISKHSYELERKKQKIAVIFKS